MRVSPRREESAGAALCCDVSAFQAFNRAPLWPGLNRWTLRRSLRDRPNDAEILRGAGDVLAAWFGAGQPWTPAAPLLGTVRALARRSPLDLACDVAAASDNVAPVPLMLGDSFATLALDFFYFGGARDLPWPVRDAAGAWLPIDCVWALDLVGVPS